MGVTAAAAEVAAAAVAEAAPVAEAAEAAAKEDEEEGAASDSDDDTLLLESLAAEGAAPSQESLVEAGEESEDAKRREVLERQRQREAYSGLRISNRLVPAEQVEVSMEGNTFAPLAELDRSRLDELIKRDRDRWVTVGVLVRASAPRKGASGKRFMTWQLSDLGNPRCASITLVLFADAQKMLQGTKEGKIILVHAAGLMPATDGRGHSLKVDTAGKVVVLGDATDFGICSFVDGERRCQRAINRAVADVCDEHLYEQYNVCLSGRTGLHSSGTSGHRAKAQTGGYTSWSSGAYNLGGAQKKTVSAGAKAAGKPAKSRFKTAEMLKGAKTQRLADKEAMQLTPGTTVITEDGLAHVVREKRKVAPAGGLSKRSKLMVEKMEQVVAQKGAAVMSQRLSRGNKHVLAACTGYNLDERRRAEELKRGKALARSIAGNAGSDALASAFGKDKARKTMHKFNTAATHVGVGPMSSDRVRAIKRAEEKALQSTVLANHKRSIAPKHDQLKRKLARTGDGAIGYDQGIVLRKEAEHREQLRRSRPEYAAAQAAQKEAEKLRKYREVKEKLEQAKRLQQQQQQRKVDGKRRVEHGPVLGGRSVPPRALSGSRLDASGAKLRKTASKTGGPSLGQLTVGPTAQQRLARQQDPTLRKMLEKSTTIRRTSPEQEGSKFAHLAKSAGQDRVLAGLANLDRAEKESDRLAQLTELRVKAVICHECEKTTEAARAKCLEEGHDMSDTKITKRFFRCNKCGERTTTLGKKKCLQSCVQCKGITWTPCSAYSDRKLGIAKERGPAKPAYEAVTTTFNFRSAQ